MRCEEVFQTGLLYHHYANTAYPLTPRSFMQYKLRDEGEIRNFVSSELNHAEVLALYIHIPFCQSRCRFCEYVVLEHTDDALETEYVDLLLKEMEMYAELLRGKKIIGYDIGGGTPTKLSIENLRRITEAVKRLFTIQEGVCFSIETTPLIAANEPEKLTALYEMGYRRISMGVQTVSEALLATLGREGSASLYERAAANIRKAGFERFNIDLMYGFLHQSDRDFEHTLRYAMGLRPDYITLYRNRYKGTKLEEEAGGVSFYQASRQYQIAYHLLTENGYGANVGKNTFSRLENDYGTSDYLTTRVIDGTPYVGMGLGAQSFGLHYLAYNLGAAEKRMERYREAILAGKLPFQDIYRLPVEEVMAKMVSVAFYFAFIDFPAFAKRFGVSFEEQYPEELRFVLEEKLMRKEGERLYLTERGADYINGVIPLFYSEHSKRELKTVFLKTKEHPEADEALFLSAYRQDAYDRPSVTADIVAVSIRSVEEESWRKDKKPGTLSLLMIRRGEHPFMNRWALPGGFLHMDETIEACALREITEETNVTPNAMMPVGVFSACDRDPRGRVISHAFVSIIGEEGRYAMGGDDALEAKWFDLTFREENGIWLLELCHEDIRLTAKLKREKERFGQVRYRILEESGFAFDHAKMIAAAMTALRNAVRDYEMLFDFLPEEFTLTALQQVQETILNESTQSANFRRKVAAYVTETDVYTSGAGHRPAKLFRRK